MERWFSSAVAKSRPVWLNFWGMPLCLWNSEFFMKVGRSIGESLLVDEGTLLRNKLDMGRMLVLIKFGKSCPNIVKVTNERRVFEISVEENHLPEPTSWIENHLDLKEVVGKAIVSFKAKRQSEYHMTVKGASDQSSLSNILNTKESGRVASWRIRI
ncbi:hypothetical protein LWI28_007925 [Acer negundo]|uniref:DUF4283 domain-containing protein n=1 Tax=Acer negundo TaxID=4023 RepID=A0AAD5IDL9_ACENE|nr:hypothetical protein LWI28_007925 [Acer negundo]